MANVTNAPSLLRPLLLRLMAPLLVIVAATGALGVYTAQWLTDRTFDNWLLDAARALAHQVHFEGGQARLNLGGDAEAIVAYDVIDRVYFSVLQGPRHIAGQPGMPHQGQRSLHYSEGVAFDAVFDSRRVRVAAVEVEPPMVGAGAGNAPRQATALPTAPATVLVAETLFKREGARQDLQLMLLPLGLLMLAAAAAILLALRRTLLPLQAIAQRWNTQSHASLQPIAMHDVPRELLPFATALNDLLARIQDMLARERRFSANAAHQIRTPLAGLQLGLSRAADAPDLGQARAVIAELQATTQRSARLLQQLLVLGRLDPEAAHDLAPATTDLVALAHDVGAAEMDRALARQIDLELLAPDMPVHVAAHADLLGEALGNLVDNALRYTPSGGKVLISVSATPPALAVDDSGPGIAPDERQTVQERFVRGAHGARHTEGSGLGLAIVREIAELHGATLEIGDSALGGARVVLGFGAPKP